ncbi:anti-sigma factor [Antrihabitans sp. YC2-6]|uniref:anti-sigma factor n=1 Tax=Antrihabitans sp. YC2-6 TaxID=2799498 RepID=UPI0018F681B3|nr:anti-sigma factor [Antrihabitans sp. YC2-6]MBJ8347429.1 anti-sigma factor [Antrihabitans sp. YC2-6]
MDDEAIDLAHAYALDTLDEAERQAVTAFLDGADETLRGEFEATVRQTRETLATLSSTVAVDPPITLRARLLEQIVDTPQDRVEPKPVTSESADAVAPPTSLAERRARLRRWQLAVVAAAAAVVLLVGGAVVGYNMRDQATQSVTEAVLAAPDARTIQTPLTVGGVATVVYSKDENAAVLLIDDLSGPPADSVYQMWLIDKEPVSAGIIAPDQVSAITTAVIEDVGSASTLAFSVEPPGGSPAPTTDPFAAISLA